jgi:cytochrome c556
MKRLLVLTGVLALGALALVRGVRADEDKEADTIKKIMQKSFGGKGAKANYRNRIQKAIKDKDWDEAGKEAKAWLKHAKKLPDLKPPRGDAAEFKKEANTLVKNITTLTDGIEKQDVKKAGGALGKIGGMCTDCHNNYRGKGKKGG